MLGKIYSITITIAFIAFLVFGGYFYFRIYKPLRFVVSELENENQSLMAILQAEREKCRQKELLSSEKVGRDTVDTTAFQDTVSEESTAIFSGGKIAFPIAVLFKGDSASLTEKGKRLIKQAWEDINKAPFRELLVLISQEDSPEANDKRAEQALAVKSYLIELGAPKDKVWAWVRNDVDYGVLELRVKR